MEPSSGSSDRPLGTTRQVYLRQDGPPDYWREGARACFPGLNLDWLTDEPIQARLERCSFDDARVTEVVDSPVHIFRQRPRTSSGGYWLILQLEGSTRYLRADRTAVDELQHPGDLLLIDPGCPFEAVSPTPVRLLAWDVPAECLIPLLAAPEAGLRRVPRRAGVSAILGSFAQALMREADRLDALSQRSLKTHLCGLIALSLGATATARESRRDTCRAVRRQQALAYVEAHLRD